MSTNRIRQHVKHTGPKVLRVFLALAMVLMQLGGVWGSIPPAQAAGGSYSLDWSAADPAVNNAPYVPTYNKVPPAALACPAPSGSAGRAADPLANAVFGNPKDAVESLAPPDMALGQIVPFEVEIRVSGSTAPENGVILFSPYWLTKTTSGGNFGYDPAYLVYCAFVDTADAATIDPGGNGRQSGHQQRADPGHDPGLRPGQRRYGNRRSLGGAQEHHSGRRERQRPDGPG
jgi:hypothetical protein